ncbi:MAG: hypothetical protein GVY27_08845 [Deinococcus-Thermus bacterium]|jgi:hypothetical protein|nr:hypothetical protein [Deinococcota bacterium]
MSEYDRILIHDRQDEIRHRALERRWLRESRDAARAERPAPSRRSALRPGRLRHDLRRLLKGARRHGMA